MDSLARAVLAMIALCSCSLGKANLNERQIATAFAQLSDPIRDPVPRSAWTSDMLVIEQDEKLRITQDDVIDILALAARQGLREPVELRSGEFLLRGNLGVSLRERTLEDPVLKLRTDRWIFLRPDSLPSKHGLDAPDREGRWRLARPFEDLETPWFEIAREYFRSGDQVWEFQANSDVGYNNALDILSAYALGEFRYAEGVEPLGLAGSHHNAHLGWISTRKSGTAIQLPSEFHLPDDWDFELEVQGSGLTFALLLLKRAGGSWLVVDRLDFAS